MEIPNYPETPMRNCMYCQYYNNKLNICTAPKAINIAMFSSNDDIDCWIFKYKKVENPEQNDEEFTKNYCIKTKCPFYYETLNLCTRPSKCPYKNSDKKSTFENLNFDKDI